MVWFKREKKLGVAQGKRRYDLPLSHSAGTGFLITLMGLMTFLAVLALSASFMFSSLGKRWSSGLENRLTVEIPATGADGKLRPPEQMLPLQAQINNALSNHPAVKESHILSAQEIGELVKPWLDGDFLIAQMPLPGLISVTLGDDTPETLAALRGRVTAIDPSARLDTHETWLNDVLRFTGALQFAAAVLTLVIGLTTITAVAGAVRSRMAEYRADVEILHLMGASDDYIARQFQRHSLNLALMGGLAGALAGGVMMVVLGWLSGRMDVDLLPDFRLGVFQIFLLLGVAPALALLAAATARRTVLNNLAEMP